MNYKIVAALVLVLAIGGLGWYLKRGAPAEQSVALSPAPAALSVPPPPAPEPSSPEPAAAPPAPAKSQAVDPTPLVAAPLILDNSDGQVRAALTDFAPALAQWLTPDEQVRKWVMLVDQLASGKLPMKNRPLQVAAAPFSSQPQGSGLQMDTANYTRADAVIDSLTAIPPARLAQYYHAWRATLDKAYSELGGVGGFDKCLRTAIGRIEQVKPQTAPPALTRPGVYFKYADPALEQASDVDKLMWRLGPKNSKRLQDYLRALEQEL